MSLGNRRRLAGSGDDDGEWRRVWRLSGWGVETSLETLRLGGGDDSGVFRWRRRQRDFKVNVFFFLVRAFPVKP